MLTYIHKGLAIPMISTHLYIPMIRSPAILFSNVKALHTLHIWRPPVNTIQIYDLRQLLCY